MSGRKQFDPDTAVLAAMRTFWMRGYSATSIADLQSAMGLSRASMYGTFGSKEELFLAALDTYTAKYGPPVREAFRIHADDALAAIDAVFNAAVRRMSDAELPPGCLVAQSAAELGALEPTSRRVVAGLIASQVSTIRGALAADVTAGRLGAGADLDTLAVYVTGVIHLLSIMHRTGTPIRTLEAVGRHAVQSLAASLRTRPHGDRTEQAPARVDPVTEEEF